MEIVRGSRSLTRRLRRPIVALGNFDGVHHGHAQLFAEVKERAAKEQGEAVVLTFDPHPAKVLAPAFAPPLITPLERKLELIAAHGIDTTLVEPFDLALAALSPAEFVDQVLCRRLEVAGVCVGYDFTFGQKRAGTVETLREFGHTRGFHVIVVPPVSVEGIVCSSTKVREFVLEGRVDGATLLLGRPPEVEGQVVHGDGRGRSIGIPTANLQTRTELIPQNGVYAGWATVLHPTQLTAMPAAINIGTKPTFAGEERTVEAHLLDVERDLYGATIRLDFVARLRGEERFPSVAALVSQIQRDIEQTRALVRFSIGAESGKLG